MTPPVSFRGATETSLHSEIRDDFFQKDPAEISNAESLGPTLSSSPRLGALSRFEGKWVEGRRFSSSAEEFSWRVRHAQESKLETVTSTRTPLATLLAWGGIALTPLLATYHGELVKWLAEHPALNTFISALGVSIFGMVHSPRSTAALMKAALEGEVAAIEELNSRHSENSLAEIASYTIPTVKIEELERLAELGNSQAKKQLRHFEIAPLLEQFRQRYYDDSPIARALVSLAKSGNAAAKKALKAPAIVSDIEQSDTLEILAQNGNGAAFQKILQISKRGFSESLLLLSLGKRGREAAKKINLQDWTLESDRDFLGLSQLAQLGHPQARKIFLQAATTYPRVAAELLTLAEAPWVKGVLKNLPVTTFIQNAAYRLEYLRLVIDFAEKGNAEAQRSLPRIDVRSVENELRRMMQAAEKGYQGFDEGKYLAPLADAGNPYAYWVMKRLIKKMAATTLDSSSRDILVRNAHRGIEVAIWVVENVSIGERDIRAAEERYIDFLNLAEFAELGNRSAQQALADFRVINKNWTLNETSRAYYLLARAGNPMGRTGLEELVEKYPENEAVRDYLRQLAKAEKLN